VELLDGKKWEWDFSIRWECKWDGNGNEVIEMRGIWYENSVPAFLYSVSSFYTDTTALYKFAFMFTFDRSKPRKKLPFSCKGFLCGFTYDVPQNTLFEKRTWATLIRFCLKSKVAAKYLIL